MKDNSAIGLAGNIYLPSESYAVAKKMAKAEVVQLRREEILRLEKVTRVKSIEVQSGIVWLTGTPASGDIILRQGERFELRDHWPFVIQAVEQAEISLSTAF